MKSTKVIARSVNGGLIKLGRLGVTLPVPAQPATPPKI